MILRAISVLETNADLKYTLQERYQYILLDEFQDTNAAQLRLVELLTDSPANEGRPNILAVGDDDQAIYAFQGAQYSNMLDFFRMFRDVLVVNLHENYRSRAEILETAKNVSAQIADTLTAHFPGLEKALVAANTKLPECVLARTEYTSEIAERAGVAAQIRQLIADGVSPSQIAVLAPKHRYLEPLVPYLEDVPLRYDRRENILDAAVVRQLLTMSRLVLALHDRNLRLSDSYWPEVLSYRFWDFPVSAIWQLSWNATDQRKPWTELLLTHEQFRPVALLFLRLAGQVETETLEVMLDRLTGTEDVTTGEADLPTVRSSLRAALLAEDNSSLYQAVSELTVLRAKLHEHQLQQDTALGLRDLLSFVDEYEAAGEQMLNTSPYSEAADAVQLMTVFKAKGLEFSHVFLLCCQDDVWGSGARGNGNKLTLPANLAPIRHAGTTEDERLRVFFVALTRAKHALYLTSHASTHAGKKPPRLKYLAEVEQADGSVTSQVLPAAFATLAHDDAEALPLEALETNWSTRHTVLTPPLHELLRERLDRYRLSPTDLTAFIDLQHGGPQDFLLQKLLRFPSAPSINIGFGNAMHETLEWLQIQINLHGSLPALAAAHEYFAARLSLQTMMPEQLAIEQARGEHALETYLKTQRFTPGHRPEYSFREEGVVLPGGVRMGGKIDLLEIDEASKTITIVDYKTGALGSDPAKRHRYELQLYCYRLLLAHSHSFRDYRVEQGCLVFVEPDSTGKITRYTVTFKDDELARVEHLVQAMWHCVQTLELPDVSGYQDTLAAIKQFEQDLLDQFDASASAAATDAADTTATGSTEQISLI
jgi:DNA helicase-2/ATP-dependent DNA helicase PcrA